MSDQRPKAESKKAFVLKHFSTPHLRRAQAEQLQKELDSLALLLSEVKKQTEKVEAAADAIGDSLLIHLEAAAAGAREATGPKRVRNNRPGKGIPPETSASVVAKPALLQRM